MSGKANRRGHCLEGTRGGVLNRLKDSVRPGLRVLDGFRECIGGRPDQTELVEDRPPLLDRALGKSRFENRDQLLRVAVARDRITCFGPLRLRPSGCL